MKITLNLKPAAMFRLRTLLEDNAEELAERLERNAGYASSEDAWRREQYAQCIATDEEVQELLVALYEALDKSETKDN